MNVNDGKAIFRHTNNAYSNVMYTAYPVSSLHLLASYRPLLYIERPDSLFFSKLSSSGFFYPGRGLSVTRVSCDNSVELIRFVSEPSSAIYHKPGCEYIKEDNDDVSSNTALSQSDASRPFCLSQDATNDGVHSNTVPSLSSNSQAPELSLPASSSHTNCFHFLPVPVILTAIVTERIKTYLRSLIFYQLLTQRIPCTVNHLKDCSHLSTGPTVTISHLLPL
ncbi:hypothetical protein Btru_061130 [Bulinus truncatus]|nr:hypothetical protein Btru_061130 [Bulinus truncatus]